MRKRIFYDSPMLTLENGSRIRQPVGMAAAKETEIPVFLDKLAALIATIPKFNQTKLEQACGLSSGRISRWKGQGEPSAREALKIARYFGCSFDWLVDESDTSPCPAPGAANRATEDDDVRFVVRTFRGLRKLGVTAEDAALWMNQAVRPVADATLTPLRDETQAAEQRQRDADRPAPSTAKTKRDHEATK